MLMFCHKLQDVSNLDHYWRRTWKVTAPAGTIPEISKSTTETVDILVGSDYFWYLVNNERIVLPSNLLLLSFKLSYIVTGKYPDLTTDWDRRSNQTVSFCVTIQKGYPNLCDL